MLKNLFLVFVGGGAGSVLRYGLQLAGSRNLQPHWLTLVANVAASLIIGILLGLLDNHRLSEGSRLLLAVGFCGGLSTYSSFAADVLMLGRRHDFAAALLYFAASNVLSLLAVAGGFYAVARFITRA